MKAEALASLCRVMGAGLAPVTPARGVTKGDLLRPKSPVLRPLRPLRLEIEERAKCDDEGAAALDDAGPDAVAVEERAGLASDRIPAVFLDVWARLNCQKPARVSEADWRLALNDGGLFLDTWGNDATALQWTPGALFDVASGLIWRLGGGRVEALGADHARLGDGRTIMRSDVAP